MMKIPILFLVLVTYSGTYAQTILDKRVSLEVNDLTLKKTLRAIERASGVKFVYSRNRLNLDERITLEVYNQKLGDVLDNLFNPRTIRHTLQPSNDYIVLSMPKDPVGTSNNQDVDVGLSKNKLIVSGTVTDVAGESLPGVNVLVKGTGYGTSTDVEGNYVLDVHNNDILIFTYVGLMTQEIRVNGTSTIEVIMQADAQSLEVVVVNAGYWQVNQKEQTGNITKVTDKDIQKQPVSNPIQAVIARAPGVYIQQTTGVPGGSFKIFLRGQNSLREEGNNPLFIVDGLPFTSSTLSLGVGDQIIVNGTSPLNNINTADIASIEILKDADATAIYGSRGANGVILVTTKRGEPGTKAEVNLYQGVSTVVNRLDLLNTKQYLAMRKEAFTNDEATPQVTDYDMSGAWDTTRYSDWQKVFTGGIARTFNAHAYISGGDQQTQFIISSGFHNQSTVYPGSFGYQKGSGHFNLNHTTADDKLNVDLSSSYYIDSNNLPRVDLTGQAITLSPVAPALYTATGELNWQDNTWLNPMFYALQKYSSKTVDFITNFSLRYTLFRNLEVTARSGYSDLRMKEFATLPIKAQNPAWGEATGEAHYGNSNIAMLIFEPQVSYTKKLRRGKVTGLAGMTFQQTKEEGTVMSAFGFTDDSSLENIQAASSVSLPSSNSTIYRYHAVFGRLNYTRDEKYIINVTGRRDGSSRFGPGKQFANFGALGLAWIFSKEKFMGWLPSLTFGKIRSSYGITGSDQIGDYEYLDTYESTEGAYLGSKGIIPSRLVNPDYQWETTKKFETSLDLEFHDGRISLACSFYFNRSSDQLADYPLPVLTGKPSVRANIPAVVQNWGWEIEAKTLNIAHSDFTWTTSLNLTIPRNKLVSYPDFDLSSYANVLEIGKSVFVKKRYVYSGVGETGIYSFIDMDGSGSITSDDQRATKEVTQRCFGGLENTFRFKNLQLDVFLQFVKQTGFNLYNDFTNPPGIKPFNQPVNVMDRWRMPGDVSKTQKFSQDFSSEATQTYGNLLRSSDYTISDASFIRLKNVSLSWYLPNKNGKLFLQGQNLFTMTEYLGTDPESQNSRLLPPLRTLCIGMQLTL